MAKYVARPATREYRALSGSFAVHEEGFEVVDTETDTVLFFLDSHWDYGQSMEFLVGEIVGQMNGDFQ